MDVLQGGSYLNEPIKNLLFREGLSFLLLLLDVVGEIANLTVLHLNIQHILLNETRHI